MGQTPVWKSIATTVAAEIARGHYRAGDKLPTEAELALRFGVNRHTVRRALADLVDRGLVHTRRGLGAFVQAGPAEYPIGRRVRFHQNIRATGRLPDKQVLRIETRPCDQTEAQALALKPGEGVVVYEGLSLSGGAPIAHFESVFPLFRLPGLAETLTRITSVTEALRHHGIADYTRAQTRITAELANATQALHLRVPEGAPLLHTQSLNVTDDGLPIERGLTWFSGEKVALTVEPD